MTIYFHHFNSLETKNRAPSRKLHDAEATSWSIVRKENDSTERNGIFLLVSPAWVHQTFRSPNGPTGADSDSTVVWVCMCVGHGAYLLGFRTRSRSHTRSLSVVRRSSAVQHFSLQPTQTFLQPTEAQKHTHMFILTIGYHRRPGDPVLGLAWSGQVLTVYIQIPTQGKQAGRPAFAWGRRQGKLVNANRVRCWKRGAAANGQLHFYRFDHRPEREREKGEKEEKEGENHSS